jgi:hypothetical protein
MRENQQEDIFLPCDDRLVAVNVGPDPTYGSLVYDTNKNNEYDGERSAWLQSAFRVIKRPLGAANAIGFQLYFTGNGETKGGFFVDTGDGSSTQPDAPGTTTASGGSGMVATGSVGSAYATIWNKQPTTYTTTNQGASGGIIIGQGSYNDGGPFHVGNKNDKHKNGIDADGNPINSLHIDTEANFYRNQAQDGPLRFENDYQKGQDAPIVVPVHLGWTGQDWAWWSTSYFYNPDPTPNRPTPYYPYYPYNPLNPTVPTTGNPTVPTVGRPTTRTPTISVPTTGAVNPTFSGGVAGGGSVTNPYFGGGGGGAPVVTGGTDGGSTGTNGGDTTGGGLTKGGGDNTAGGTPQPGDIIGYTDDGIPIRQPPSYNPKSNPPTGPNPPGNGGQPSGGNPTPTGPAIPHIPPDIPIYVLPDLPVISDVINGNIQSGGPLMNMISSTGAVVSQGTQYAGQNYNPNAATGGLFNSALASGSAASAVNKSNNSDPLCGAASSFAAQGGNIAPSPAPSTSPTPPSPSPTPSPTPSPAPSTTTGGKGDPYVYTQTPRDTTDTGKQRSRYKRGTASGGICYHPSETDLRDIPVGLVPQNTSLSTTTVTVGPNAYFAAGVPELVNGSIKSGYRWGVDTTTGDLVFYSISFSQPPIEAIRFCNAGQVIRWRSTENFYGELSHANTGNQRYSFPDTTGTVLVNTLVAADGATSLVLNGHTGGSGPTSTTMKAWLKMRGMDGLDYLIAGYQ